MKLVWIFTFIVIRFVCSQNIDDGDPIDLSEYGARLFGYPNSQSGDNLNQWQQSENINPEELGTYLEGDILFPMNSSTSRNGIVGQTYRWPNGVVPFEISGGFDARAMDLIEKAMDVYLKNTCVQFKRRSAERDYIIIQSTQSGCWSSVGRIGGQQVVNLQSPSCTTLIGTIIHEFMHTVGFFHEQNRDERDKFVTVMMANIRRGYEENFRKMTKGTSSGFNVAYDYGSVMHYSEMAFSSNGSPTIKPKVIIFRTFLLAN